MVTSYTENPDNFYEVSELVESEAESIKEIFFQQNRSFSMMPVLFRDIQIYLMKKKTF